MPASDSETPRPVVGLEADRAGIGSALEADRASPVVGGEAGSRGGGRRVSGNRRLLDLAVIVVVALVAALVVRTFVLQSFYIPSRSMEPTLQVGDRIIVNKLSYRIHGVGRGDIIVFARPPREAAICSPPPVNDLVKRVVGLPGEMISLSGGQVYIDGRLLPEPWLPAGTQTVPGPGDLPYSLNRPFQVPKGEYFVMGDNRSESCDSRYWGPIPRSLIVGKVDMRIWPVSRIAWF